MKLSIEEIAYNHIEAEIAELSVKRDKLADAIIKLYCPYKIGDKLKIHTHSMGLVYCIISKISYKGYDEDAVDNKWNIKVIICDGKWNKSEIPLTIHSGDKIEKI